jgi:hypothetical protein
LLPFATEILGRSHAMFSLSLRVGSHRTMRLVPAAVLRAVGSLSAGRTEFLRSHLAITIAVELPQDVRGLAEFLRIDPAIAICIQRAEKSGHGPGSARAFRLGSGSVLWSAAIRGTGRGIVLGAERPGRECECHGGGKDLSGVHHGSGLS